MDRNSKAILGPQEVASLRLLRTDASYPISAPHRLLLLSGGLIEGGVAGWRLTLAGRDCLARDDAGTVLPASPPALRPVLRA